MLHHHRRPTILDPLKRYATRAAAAQRPTGRMGLGLYIEREIVVAKGGRDDGHIARLPLLA